MMVMLYHASYQPEVKTIAYILCLPAFFFVAGLFANTEMPPTAFFKHKSLRLLIPYITFGVLCWLLWLVIRLTHGNEAEETRWWVPLCGIICGKVELLVQNRPLWFLCCMVSTEWIYYALRRVPSRIVRWFGACVIAALGCLLGTYGKTGVWEITAAMLMLPVYMAGAEYSTFFRGRINKFPFRRLATILIFSVVGIIIGYFFNPEFHISTCVVGNPILFYLTAFSVVGFWLAVTAIMDKWTGTHKWLLYFGQNTLIVLCTHIPLFGLIKGVGILCNIFPLSFWTTNIGSIALWAISLVLLFPISYCINRYFPFLIGKRVNPLSV